MSYWLRRLRELCLWEFYPVQWTCFRNSAGFVLSLITGRVNLADTLLTSQKRWIAHAQQEFGKWSARWRLGNRFVTIWNYICHHIWNQQRLQAAHRAGICTVQEIFHELRSLKQFVICPADHHPYRAHLCCSRHFHFLLIKRFMAEIFTRCSVGWNTVFHGSFKIFRLLYRRIRANSCHQMRNVHTLIFSLNPANSLKARVPLFLT